MDVIGPPVGCEATSYGLRYDGRLHSIFARASNSSNATTQHLDEKPTELKFGPVGT